MHKNKAIINKIWWELLREGVPVSNTDADNLELTKAYGGGTVLASGYLLWLVPQYDSTCFYTDAGATVNLRNEVDLSDISSAIHTLGEAWRNWSSEHNVTVPDGYLRKQMAECICNMLNERGVPAEFCDDGGNRVSIHDCYIVCYERCYLDVNSSVKFKEDITTSLDTIHLYRENMDTILIAVEALANRYNLLPSKTTEEQVDCDKRPPEAVKLVAPETVKDMVAGLGNSLDDGFNYRLTCAKCLTVISKGLEANPDDAKLWRLHNKFVNSMNEISMKETE